MRSPHILGPSESVLEVVEVDFFVLVPVVLVE